MSSWREERRKDQAAAAKQARADRVAGAQIGIEQRKVDNEARVAAMRVRAEQVRKDRADRRRVRAARVAKLRRWLVEEAPAAIVMGAPMLLAWTAMAAYGFGHVLVSVGHGNDVARDQILAFARAGLASGAAVTEFDNGTHAGVHVAFGPVQVQVYAGVEKVHDVTRIVEYTPRSILAEITRTDGERAA